MKVKYIVVCCLLICISMIAGCDDMKNTNSLGDESITENTSDDKSFDIIIPDLILETKANTDYLYRVFHWKLGTELTWWEQLYDQEQINENEYELPQINIDFNTKTCIVSIGRKIVDIRNGGKFSDNTSFIAIVTYEDQYYPETAFIYTIDDIVFVPSDLEYSDVYKLIDGERVYWGKNNEINTHDNTYNRVINREH